MNIFADTATFLGTAEPPDGAFFQFLTEAAGLGDKLGGKRALLDAYLLCLLRLAARPQAAEWAGRGENSMRALRLQAMDVHALSAAFALCREEKAWQLHREGQKLRLSPEWRAMERLYTRLRALLHGETELERLGGFFIQAFLQENAAGFFSRGALEDVMMALSSPGSDGGGPLLCRAMDLV